MVQLVNFKNNIIYRCIKEPCSFSHRAVGKHGNIFLINVSKQLKYNIVIFDNNTKNSKCYFLFLGSGLEFILDNINI